MGFRVFPKVEGAWTYRDRCFWQFPPFDSTGSREAVIARFAVLSRFAFITDGDPRLSAQIQLMPRLAYIIGTDARLLAEIILDGRLE